MLKIYKCFSEANSLIFFIICKLSDSRNIEFLDILFDLKLKIQLVPESTLSKMDERVQKVYNIYCVEEDSFDAVEFSNSYQEFASTPFTSSSRIRFRRFILNTIRDKHKHRVYSPYLKATFNFNFNGGIYKIKIHDIITNYEPINAR